MSIAVYWRPLNDKPNRFEGGTSTSFAALKSFFGLRLSKADIRALHAMSVATGDRFYSDIADKVAEVGDIELWGEW